MYIKTEETILKAKYPSDIFSMNPDTLEDEKEAYLERFKPKPYSAIENFVLSQKVTILYRQALEILKVNPGANVKYNIHFESIDGSKICDFNYHYLYDIKLGEMYVADKNIIFVIDSKYEKYFNNYIEKTAKFPKLDPQNWSKVEYMLPKVSSSFVDKSGKNIIALDKPCEIYPLREIVNYFGGKIEATHVASIITRLHQFICYINVCCLNHNGISLDNLFFNPGRKLEEGEPFTTQDLRIVGVYGGWFFSTWKEEKVTGMPKDLYEYLPQWIKNSDYSSFELDIMCVKKLALDLLGGDLTNVPEALKNWINSTECCVNAYEQFKQWEKVVIESFGRRSFIHMDISAI